MLLTKSKWFPGSVMYQIYPRSFCDSNNDGVGDLRGIINKLHYLRGDEASLGVDGIWLSPFYASPMADFGYDVADHCAVDPVYGSMADIEELIVLAHQRQIRVMLDFVPNHTSDQHLWFQESRSSKTSPKRDWYTWADPKADGSEPNNWLSAFGGSAWEYDKESGQYYLHTFLKQQPDLNWRNPEVRNAMKNVMRFWLDKGADGFRIDAVYWLSKDEQLRDEPVNTSFDVLDSPYDALKHIYSREGPMLYNYLKELSELVGSYGDKVLVTEAYPAADQKSDHYMRFYDLVNPDVLSPFNFCIIVLKWDVATLKKYIDNFQSNLKPTHTPVYVLGNHDSHRVASRIGPRAARTAAVLLLCLPGTPFIYYGDEIGLQNINLSDSDLISAANSNMKQGSPSREPERSPMQWSDGKHAGFTTSKPWLPISSNFKFQNVISELADPNSILNLYKRLIELRRRLPELRKGEYIPVKHDYKDVFVFERRHRSDRILVVLNFSAEKRPIGLGGKVLLSSARHARDNELAPHEGRVIKLI